MRPELLLPFRLSAVLALAMAVQPLLGLAFPELYRDEGWVRATWFGNDAVTLGAAVPLLAGALVLARRGSPLGTALWAGMLGYATYNFAFYLLGARVNAFFLLYVASFLLAALALVLLLARLDVRALADHFDARTPARRLGGYFVFVAAGLACVWIAMWALHVFAGRPLPGGEEAFRLVAALDLTLMVPALGGGGMLLWRRRPWGFAIGAVAGVQGSLYLVVLAVNAAVAVRLGLEEAPGQLPLWAPLALTTGAATALLLRHLPWRPERGAAPQHTIAFPPHVASIDRRGTPNGPCARTVATNSADGPPGSGPIVQLPGTSRTAETRTCRTSSRLAGCSRQVMRASSSASPATARSTGPS